MTDQDAVERLRAAMTTETLGHHLDPGAADAALRDAQTRRLPILAVAASLVAVLAIAFGVAWLRSGGDDTKPPASHGTCVLETSPLPDWADAGFSAGSTDMPHVTGDRGQIVAIPFVTLRVNQPEGTHNKILWASQDKDGGTLQIRATLGDLTVNRSVPLGPSYVDLPQAGCWHLELLWAGHRDELNLAYSA